MFLRPPVVTQRRPEEKKESFVYEDIKEVLTLHPYRLTGRFNETSKEGLYSDVYVRGVGGPLICVVRRIGSKQLTVHSMESF